ncbi:glucose-6-phosphate dehydrogenase [Candidatus Shapirobacteria bacterium]|nr:glucose-6-phosphate dehydrogenase [Candidatus Shapirobacteria bacterium]
MKNNAFAIVIFGATGDLARNKLLPALFRLCQHRQLGSRFYIIGFARRPLTNLQFRQEVSSMFFLKKEEKKDLERFLSRLHYQQGLFEDVAGYNQLIKLIHEIDAVAGERVKRIFYLATAPDRYNTILSFLEKTKLSKGHDKKNKPRVALEKPFGKDLETAKRLDKKLSQIFPEEQIFRVDHYLGKETVQNILTFRFANNIFEPVWNKEYIDHAQITFAEKKGIMGRGRFFDGVGLLRDVGQNHLMQLLASVVMEQPKSFARDGGVRDARSAAISAIRCIEPEDVEKYVVRGQYTGYLAEEGVMRDSQTETFVAMKLFIKTPRFSGVPFYLRAGKKMPKNHVSISVIFRQTCHVLFKEYGCPEVGNILTFHIQPDEGITLSLVSKRPSPVMSIKPVSMRFSYKEAFGRAGVEAYEKLLLDILAGDQMLFNRSDELESSWDFITKILKGWESQKAKVKNYKPGMWGPKEANELIEKDGRKWL